MKNWNKTMKLLAVGILLTLSYAVYVQVLVIKQSKEIESLNSEVYNLKSEVEDLEDEKQETEEELESVKNELDECVDENENMLRRLRWSEYKRDDLEWQRLMDNN